MFHTDYRLHEEKNTGLKENIAKISLFSFDIFNMTIRNECSFQFVSGTVF